jgi:hypothetical protein
MLVRTPDSDSFDETLASLRLDFLVDCYIPNLKAGW